DRVCICGVDSQGTTFRPILPYGVRRRNLVDSHGSFIIKPFAVVKFELMKPRPQPPHIEDVRWDLIRGPVFMRNLSGQEQKELMEHLAYKHVQEIFSAPIFENRFIKEGDGLRSIGTLKPHEIIAIDFIKNSEGNYNYYMEFMDKDHETFKLPVTDCVFLKYFDKGLDNGYSPDEIADDLRDKFEKNESFLRLSLTPSFKNAHWIQITGAYNYP
ncbi:MAG: hypothetical protein KUA29_03010, partial [Methanobacterium sp.]|nr:hypothetical protein [Methanobacterium sp.]